MSQTYHLPAGVTLRLVQGDITGLAVDAIVNAANSRMQTERLGLTSIVFPALSTGVFGFSLQRAAELLVGVARLYGRMAGARIRESPGGICRRGK